MNEAKARSVRVAWVFCHVARETMTANECREQNGPGQTANGKEGSRVGQGKFDDG